MTAFVDDILIYSSNAKEHREHIVRARTSQGVQSSYGEDDVKRSKQTRIVEIEWHYLWRYR